MHPAVLLVLILVAGVFAAIGALVLWLTPWPGLSWASLFWFVLSAFIGAGATVFAFNAIAGPLDGWLGSDRNVTVFVLCLALAGFVVGWLGAGAAIRLLKRSQKK